MDDATDPKDDEDLDEDGCVHEFRRVFGWRTAIQAFFGTLAERWPSGHVLVQPRAAPAIELPLKGAHIRDYDIGVVTIFRKHGVPDVFPCPTPTIAPEAEHLVKMDFWAEGPDVARILLRTAGWAPTEPSYGRHDAFSKWVVELLEGITGTTGEPDYGLMMPGGFDSKVGDLVDPEGVVARFLSALALRWPQMIVDSHDDARTEYRRFPPGEHRLQLRDGTWIFMSRDEMMVDHQDETGGRPMPDGDGPLTLIVGKQEDGAWRMTLVTPEDSEKDPFSTWARETLSAACGRDVSPIRYTEDAREDTQGR